MLASLLLASNLAHAQEIGVDRRFGIGVATGWPLLSATGKYWIDEQSGIAAFVGLNGLFGLQLKGQYEREIATFQDYGWGAVGANWHVGGELDVYPIYAGALDVGPYGGANVWMRFHEVPAELFTGPSIGIAFWTIPGYASIAPIYDWQLGGRWYF